MAVAATSPLLALLLLVLPAVLVAGDAGSYSSSFNMTNNCSYTVWPGISSGAGSAALETMGFQLRPSQWKLVAVPYAWTGRVWGRTLCSTDSITGRFTCVTGDCGTGCEDCAGGGAAAPITLAQFQMNGVGGRDSYVVTVVDGFNIPMMVAPPPPGAGAGGDDDCAPTGCLADLNGACPPDLRVTSDTAGPVACMSACQAFGSPEYCCTGEHGDPSTCTPSVYSEAFKQVCPLAITYPYDVVASSIFSCGGGGDTAITYAITFCPNTDSGYTPAAGNEQPPLATPSTVDDSLQVDASRIAIVVGVLSLITAALGLVAECLGVFKKCCS